VVCGIGETKRPVDCVNTEGEVVNDTECTRMKAETTELCDMGTCAQGWFLTTWSKKVNGTHRLMHVKEFYLSLY